MIERVLTYTTNVNDLFEHIIKEDDFELNHVIIEPEKFFPKHPTDANVTIILITGELSIILGDQEKNTYSKGTVIQIDEGIESVLGNDGDELVELFVLKRR